MGRNQFEVPACRLADARDAAVGNAASGSGYADGTRVADVSATEARRLRRLGDEHRASDRRAAATSALRRLRALRTHLQRHSK